MARLLRSYPTPAVVARAMNTMSMRSLPALLVASAFSMLVIAGGEALSKDVYPSRVDSTMQPQVFTGSRDQDKANTQGPKQSLQDRANQKETLCLAVESAARANDLPLGFFARVIWQESRFRSNAVGPITHDGQHAL
ncbi:MAG: hypothetical protein ACREDL_18610, partial [Bradyrhizobium sp.]